MREGSLGNKQVSLSAAQKIAHGSRRAGEEERGIAQSLCMKPVSAGCSRKRKCTFTLLAADPFRFLILLGTLNQKASDIPFF